MKSRLPNELRTGPFVPAAIPPEIAYELGHAAARLWPLGYPLHYFAVVTSTNDVATRLAEFGAAEGTTVVADAQTAGRGRRGRTWFSPSGAGLYVSVILRPPRDLVGAGSAGSGWASSLTLAAGVALAEGIQVSTGLPVELKWPNDLIAHPRKLGGILAEAYGPGDGFEHVILGYGINLGPAAYPPELAEKVTSIETELGRPVDRAIVLAETLARLAACYLDLKAGRFDAILTAWRARAPSSRGSLVEWDVPEGVRRGRTEGVDSRGALLVRVEGTLERLVAGEVRWIDTS